jgi:hypothetical protein
MIGSPTVIAPAANRLNLFDLQESGDARWDAWLGSSWAIPGAGAWNFVGPVGNPWATIPAPCTDHAGSVGAVIRRTDSGKPYWFGGTNAAPWNGGFYDMGSLY